MPVNEKKLLEKFINMEAAINMLAQECKEAKRELGEGVKLSRAKINDNAIEQMVNRNREKAQLRRLKRFQNQ